MGQMICTIRDLTNIPVPGSVVTVDFTDCTDLAIASDQHDPRVFVNCGPRTVSAVTGVNGQARFTLIGTGTPGPAHASHSLRIYADGVLMGSLGVGVFERDGVGGLTLADLAYWAQDYFSGVYRERADLDGIANVSLLDLSWWSTAYFNGNNVIPAGPYCP